MNNPSMQEYYHRIKRIFRYSIIIIILFLIGIITPYYPVFLGLALGTVVGLINFFFTIRMVNKLGEIASQSNDQQKKKPVFSGMTTRFSTAILAVLIVYQYPEHFHLVSTLLGFFVVQVIMVVDGLRNNIN